jgi:hypothetical protein
MENQKKTVLMTTPASTRRAPEKRKNADAKTP